MMTLKLLVCFPLSSLLSIGATRLVRQTLVLVSIRGFVNQGRWRVVGKFETDPLPGVGNLVGSLLSY